jgi:UDP-N-acetylmuramate dehydrogenase
MDTQKVYSNIKSQFPSLEIYQNHSLAPYTTVKIGGPADIFIHTKSSEELKNVLSFCRDATHGVSTAIPTTILGNGSNVLISDSGIRGIVIKNDSNKIELLPNNQVKADSGVQLSQLINFTLDHNLLNLEEFAYIPSTVGGAITGNIHGDDKHLFSQFVESIEKIDNFIISAILKLSFGDSTAAKQKVKDIIQRKSTIQLTNSLGSVFKNIPGQNPSGMIIDQKLNLKGYSIGDAQISPLHANFIVNNDHATAADYFKLIKFIQTQAKEKLNLNLEPEIKFLGQF